MSKKNNNQKQGNNGQGKENKETVVENTLQETKLELKELDTIMEGLSNKESNEHDVEIAKVVVGHLSEKDKLKHERELKEIEFKNQMTEWAKGVEEAQMKSKEKVRIFEIVGNTVSTVAVAAAASVWMFGASSIMKTVADTLEDEE